MLTSMLAMAAMAQTAEAPKIGATAPSWTLTDTKGKTHRLEDFRGKYVGLPGQVRGDGMDQPPVPRGCPPLP